MEPQESSPGKWEGLQTRIISAGALLICALACVMQGGVIFIALVMLAAILMMREWDSLTAHQMLILRFAGYPFIIIPSSCLIWLRAVSILADPTLGLSLVIALIAVICATDMGAYFTGKRLGRYKLAPFISPNKTWEGLAGGTLAAMVTALLFSPYIHLQHSLASAVLLGLIMALLAQGGDLLKSWIKRLAGVKDSGTLIPGHGGILDRLDGYILTTPLLALVIHHLIT